MISQLVRYVFCATVALDLAQPRRHDWLIHLDERRNVECFLYLDRHFCHFSEENDHLTRDVKNNSCQISGTPLSFIMLKKKNIRPETLIDWLIPFHLIEQYAGYWNSRNSTASDSTLVCNCTFNRLGIACQYEIENKDWELTRLLETQRGRSSNEYETLTSLIDGISCDGSVPPVEWRQICDGIAQCEDASDEFNCHRLELNQCDEDDEYRCRNGMCIPKEFAFDGTLDCMDSSDEQEIASLVRVFDPCSDQSLFRCDERLCRKDQFSCGDGQCVPWSTLLISEERGCRNSRHLADRCEIDGNLLSTQKNLTGICRQTTESLEALTNKSSCFVSLRHFLTTDREETFRMSMDNLRKNCSELIEYPERSMFSPVLMTFYNRSQLEVVVTSGIVGIRLISRRAHLFCLRGKMICDGQLMEISRPPHGEYCMTNEQLQEMISKYPFIPFSHLFCRLVNNELFSSQ